MPEPRAPNEPDSHGPDIAAGPSVWVLQAGGLSRSFGPVEVLSDVSIDVRAGEVQAIIGENGPESRR